MTDNPGDCWRIGEGVWVSFLSPKKDKGDVLMFFFFTILKKHFGSFVVNLRQKLELTKSTSLYSNYLTDYQQLWFCLEKNP